MSNQRLKIVFIGRYTEGETGIVRSIQMGLIENGYQLYEINLSTRPYLMYNPYKKLGGHGPVYIKWELIEKEVRSFQPDVILLCAGGLTFHSSILAKLKQYCTVVGLTLSDPDVFPSVSKYVGEFDYHTTNSAFAYHNYKKEGIQNTYYLPFGIDSRFFIPWQPMEKYASDVAIIGHYRADRLKIAQAVQDKYGAKIYGRGWPIKNEGPVYNEEWFKAMYSTKMVINFPKTGAGFTNVKVGVFEAIATGRLVFTEYFDEMDGFFEYDKEIIGYRDVDDLIEKIDYYRKNWDEGLKIAKAGQKKCAQNHTWKQRLNQFFQRIKIKSPQRMWRNYPF